MANLVQTTYTLRSAAPGVNAGDATPVDCGEAGAVVTNAGSVTAYYNDELPVTTSSTSLAAGASVALTGINHFFVPASATATQSTTLTVLRNPTVIPSDELIVAMRPTGVIAQTVPRWGATNQTTPSTGRLDVYGGCVVPANRVVTAITFITAGTAGASLTNVWFALIDQNGNVLRKTAEDTASAWAIDTTKTLNLSSVWAPTVDTPVYLGIVVVGTTPPALAATVSTRTGVPTLAPKSAAQTTSTGLTNPASLSATSVTLGTVQQQVVYGYLT